MKSGVRALNTKTLKNIFRRNMLIMLLAKGKITADLIAPMDQLEPSSFINSYHKVGFSLLRCTINVCHQSIIKNADSYQFIKFN